VTRLCVFVCCTTNDRMGRLIDLSRMSVTGGCHKFVIAVSKGQVLPILIDSDVDRLCMCSVRLVSNDTGRWTACQTATAIRST
jgi:hypothetical protein